MDQGGFCFNDRDLERAISMRVISMLFSPPVSAMVIDMH